MLAPIIVGTGVVMVNLASMGMAPNDILSVWLFTRQKKLPYRAVRIIYDVVQLAIGLALGGVVGIGTVLSAVLTDPAIQAASDVLEKAHAPADADRIAQINIAHILFLLHMMDTPLVDSLKRGVYRSVQKIPCIERMQGI